MNKGLIRIGIDVPADAEFVVDSVDDPYQCGASLTGASLYRRPLPATNLRFLSAVMWDGRESSPTTAILQDLAHQANEATRGHAMAALDLTRRADAADRRLRDGRCSPPNRATSGRETCTPAARRRARRPVAPAFLYWHQRPGRPESHRGAFRSECVHAVRRVGVASRPPTRVRRRPASVARGQNLFNTRLITLSGVAGLNDQTFSNGVTLPASFNGTCTTCHDSPNAGDHSVKAPLNIGLTDESRRTPDCRSTRSAAFQMARW